MHNLKFIRKRFPDSQAAIIRAILAVVLFALALGIGLFLLMV